MFPGVSKMHLIALSVVIRQRNTTLILYIQNIKKKSQDLVKIKSNVFLTRRREIFTRSWLFCVQKRYAWWSYAVIKFFYLIRCCLSPFLSYFCSKVKILSLVMKNIQETWYVFARLFVSLSCHLGGISLGDKMVRKST